MKRVLGLLCLCCSTLLAEPFFKPYVSNEVCTIEYAWLFPAIDTSQTLTRTPLLVKIDNKSLSKQSWFIATKSDWSEEKASISRQTLTVERQSLRTFVLEVPSSSYVRFSGFGIEGAHYTSMHHSRSGSNSGLLATRTVLNMLKKDPGENNYSYSLISPTTFKYFPDSWTGYSSLRELFLSSDEFNKLREAQKNSLKEWVLNGGILRLVDQSTEHKELIYKFFGTTEPYFGLGRLSFVAPQSDPRHFARSLPVKQFEQSYSSSVVDKLWRTVNEPQVSFALVTCLLLLFFLGVGPLNMYVLTKGRPLRMLVTVPLISIGTSVVFLLAIILYDGFGSEGIKKSFVWLSPQHNRAVIKQNQMVKNAIMFNPAFKRQSDYLLQAYQRSLGDYPDSVQVILDGEWVSGDMFNSRTRRLMSLSDVRSTQAALEFISGQTPSIRSNFKSRLQNIMVCDQEGNSWQAASCGPGENVELVAAELPSKAASEKSATIMNNSFGSADLFKRLQGKKKFFFTAEAIDSAEFDIVTNTAVDWTGHDLLIGGDLLEAKP